MLLTRFTDLSLRVLMYLSKSDPDRVPAVTIAEIATQFDVPHNHLIKVVNRMAKLGWVETTRGRKGGLRIAPHAGELRLGGVVKELEARDELIDCAGVACALTGNCLLKGVLDKGLAALYAEMDKYTLADVVANRTGTSIIKLHKHWMDTHPTAH